MVIDVFPTLFLIMHVHLYEFILHSFRLYQESMQRFTAAIEQNPKVGQFYIHRARARYMVHDIDAARHDVLVSLHLDPDNDEVDRIVSWSSTLS